MIIGSSYMMLKGTLHRIAGMAYHWVVLFLVCLCSSQHVLSQKTKLEPKDKFLLSDPPIGLFDPIDISPSDVPRDPNPVEPLSPMYPNYTSYEPILTGKCHVNFSSLSYILEKTASDCAIPLAPLVADVICCPQVNSLMHVFQAAYGSGNNTLVLNQASANACFSDVMSILASKGANTNIPELCTLRPSNLTDASCPVKDISTFEKIVNVSKLLGACSSVDPLKECCRPVCQTAIAEAAIHISSGGANMLGSSSIPGSTAGIDVLSDCKGVVQAWLSMKLSLEDANSAFRVLSGCKVNKGMCFHTHFIFFKKTFFTFVVTAWSALSVLILLCIVLGKLADTCSKWCSLPPGV
jgi:hypothetical protein